MPLDLERIRPRFPGRAIHWFPTIDSTMYEAVRLANAGCASGTIVGADEQTAGHGRYGRTWHSEPETGLYQSIVLRLPVEPERIPIVTLGLGLAVAAAIGRTAGAACDLRWVNDALIGGRKCAGILAQLHGDAVVAGIGINVNQTRFPDDVSAIATSVRIATGSEQSREDLLIALLEEIDHHCEILVERGPSAILEMYARVSSYVAGRRVTVEEGGRRIEGVTAGLTEAGFLRVRRDDGVEELIVGGGVRPA